MIGEPVGGKQDGEHLAVAQPGVDQQVDLRPHGVAGVDLRRRQLADLRPDVGGDESSR